MERKRVDSTNVANAIHHFLMCNFKQLDFSIAFNTFYPLLKKYFLRKREYNNIFVPKEQFLCVIRY